jgi:hypothetical protein
MEWIIKTATIIYTFIRKLMLLQSSRRFDFYAGAEGNLEQNSYLALLNKIISLSPH